MKILICTNHSYMFWQFRRELTESLLQEHEVLLSTPFVGREKELRKLGCRLIETSVDRRGMNPVTDMKLFRFYQDLLNRERPDLVITYSIKCNVYAGYACRLMKIPYCANVQGLGTAFQKPVLSHMAGWLYKVALKDAKTTFFENRGNAQEFVRRKIQTADRQLVLPGAGINLNHFIRQSYPRNKKFRFLYLGRIMQEKGIDELFWAAEQLKASGECFTLDLVGFYEDSYKEQVEQLVHLGIARFHGFQPEPRPYYGDADCIVMPSYHEGMSNVLLEAAATGRPLITSRIHGCMEAVEEDVSGLLVTPRNREALLEAMRRMLHTPREARAEMGAAGRARMEQLFEKDKVVNMTVEALLKP